MLNARASEVLELNSGQRITIHLTHPYTFRVLTFPLVPLVMADFRFVDEWFELITVAQKFCSNFLRRRIVHAIRHPRSQKEGFFSRFSGHHGLRQSWVGGHFGRGVIQAQCLPGLKFMEHLVVTANFDLNSPTPAFRESFQSLSPLSEGASRRRRWLRGWQCWW